MSPVPSSKAADVQKMFARISKPYDFLNRFFSLGIDQWWRFQLIRSVTQKKAQHVLDLATGSGDVALQLQKAGLSPIGLDFCFPMLKQAQTKAPTPLDLVTADALNLPFSDNTFDAITVAFGFRNFENKKEGLQEIIRVLKPGGSLHLLEFSQPYFWFRPFYFFYLKNIMPLIARIFSKDFAAYLYLGATIEAFPSAPDIGNSLQNSGFKSISWKRMTFGIVALHIAHK